MKESLTIVEPPPDGSSPCLPRSTAKLAAIAAARPAIVPELAPAEAAFAAELERLRPALAALLRRAVASVDLRDDALQEAFARAWRSRASYDPTRPLGPWLATIALRVAKEQERGRRRRPEHGGDSAGAAELAVDADPLPQLAQREEFRRLAVAVAELVPLQRSIVERFYREGAAVAAIAAELELPVNTVKSHLRRARLALAQRLGGPGGPGEGAS